MTLATGKMDPTLVHTSKVKSFTPLENIGRHNKAKMSLTGFTFIEILFVIIIIGILIGNSLPNFRKTFNNLRLNNFSRELQAFMNYLCERSIVEREIIYLNIDNEKKEFWAQIRNAQGRLKSYPIPDDIKLETEKNQILFYPDGQVDKVTINVINLDNQKIILTTKGVFSGVKLLSQE